MHRPVLLLSMLLMGSQTALAWDADLVCPMPEADSTPSEPASIIEPTMCSAELPHFMRDPSHSEWQPVGGQEQAEDAVVVAARALTKARTLAAAGLFDDALLNLRVVEATMPRIADYVALERAELHLRAEQPARAAEAYKAAMHASVGLDLSARAHVGYVQSLLRAQSPLAVKEAESLLARYVELPEAPLVRLELAQYRERAGQIAAAIATYRTLDLTLPGYPVAERARWALAALTAQGHKVLPYSAQEQLDRAERLLRSGPLELAQETFAELSKATLLKPFAQRRDALQQALQEKLGKHAPQLVAAAPSTATPPINMARVELEKRLARETAPLRIGKLRPPMLLALLTSASSEQLRDASDLLVAELTKRAVQSAPDLRFEALVVSAGTASDEKLIALADTLLAHPTLGVASRYHRARALERSQDFDGAKAELQRVITDDQSITHFYGQFAEQRLRALNAGTSLCQKPGRNADCNRDAIESTLTQLEQHTVIDPKRALELLTPVAQEHGDAYPWLLRATDLVQLGELEAAGDELHEAYLAFRWVARRGPLRAGRVAIYRGKSVVQPAPDFVTQRARLQLNMAARETLAQAAYAIGDVGTAVELGGTRFAEQTPEAYASEVARVARKYGLDPDLLFAVMRVESVFQRRIISHAGAIGLMQIMPRTGRLIADKLGLQDTSAVDLLDPRFNLELSGWYLSSLIERMDGRLPLAIASYNGGPHNVRRWIDQYGQHVPLDAFLERIPFTETKRYVRRVLGYYGKYKAARGQSMDLIALSLPNDKPNGVSF